MLPFLEERISVHISEGMKSTPTVPGRVKRYGPTGSLTQNFSAAFPIHKFDLAHGVKTAAEFQSILDIWYIVNFTPYEGFLLRDWRDYLLTQQNSRLSNIAGNAWQINRLHTYGVATFLRPIYKPEAGVIVKRNRSGVITTATASVETTTGIATISGHVGGDTYSAEGSFNLPVTFTNDEWDAELIRGTHDILHVGGSIELEEIRLNTDLET